MKVCKLQNRWSFTGFRYGALCVYPSLAKTQHLSAMFPYNNLTSSVGPGHTNPFGPPSNTHAPEHTTHSGCHPENDTSRLLIYVLSFEKCAHK